MKYWLLLILFAQQAVAAYNPTNAVILRVSGCRNWGSIANSGAHANGWYCRTGTLSAATCSTNDVWYKNGASDATYRIVCTNGNWVLAVAGTERFYYIDRVEGYDAATLTILLSGQYFPSGDNWNNVNGTVMNQNDLYWKFNTTICKSYAQYNLGVLPTGDWLTWYGGTENPWVRSSDYNSGGTNTVTSSMYDLLGPGTNIHATAYSSMVTNMRTSFVYGSWTWDQTDTGWFRTQPSEFSGYGSGYYVWNGVDDYVYVPYLSTDLQMLGTATGSFPQAYGTVTAGGIVGLRGYVTHRLQQVAEFTLTGGTVSDAGDYWLYTFFSNVSYSIMGSGFDADLVLVAGGGGGSSDQGAGGAAGGIIVTSLHVSGNGLIVVGAGGTNGTPTTSAANGSNTTAFGLTAYGGGASTNLGTVYGTPGSSGGSGAGGKSRNAANATAVAGGSATNGQGYAGGAGSGYASGGGGGACGPGGDGTSSASPTDALTGGAGGTGTNVSWIGVNMCGGGAGSVINYSGGAKTAGTATHGGGNASVTGVGSNGVPHTGGGGGGGGWSSGTAKNGGAGGSGAVYLRKRK